MRSEQLPTSRVHIGKLFVDLYVWGNARPDSGLARFTANFEAIIVGRPASGTCAAYNPRQCFESLTPIPVFSALSILKQQLQPASHCSLLRGYHAKHNSFSWHSKLLANKILDYGCHWPCT